MARHKVRCAGARRARGARAGLQCLQLCADALCTCDLSPLSALTNLRALAITSHNDRQRYAVPPVILGARAPRLGRRLCGRGWLHGSLALRSRETTPK
jgi:hypothetical protein